MSNDDVTQFRQLFRRVREGDPRAAEELVRAYEGDIRRTIRVRMTDSRLRQLVDSVDICQSVLANFFVRAASGQFDCETPAQLIGLLVTMARNRITDLARHQHSDRRDGRRTVSLEQLAGPVAGLSAADPTPSAIAIGQELLARVVSRLTVDERPIFEWRAQGLDWDEIARRLQSQKSTVRMRLVRALDRVSRDLGLEAAADV